MLTINQAIDYATDNQVVISTCHTLKVSRRKTFTARKGDLKVVITQSHQGSRHWRVNGRRVSRADAIMIAINMLNQGLSYGR